MIKRTRYVAGGEDLAKAAEMAQEMCRCWRDEGINAVGPGVRVAMENRRKRNERRRASYAQRFGNAAKVHGVAQGAAGGGGAGIGKPEEVHGLGDANRSGKVACVLNPLQTVRFES